MDQVIYVTVALVRMQGVQVGYKNCHTISHHITYRYSQYTERLFNSLLLLLFFFISLLFSFCSILFHRFYFRNEASNISTSILHSNDQKMRHTYISTKKIEADSQLQQFSEMIVERHMLYNFDWFLWLLWIR